MADLKILAEQLARLYAENPKVDGVLLGGSVSRGWQDRYSDIELLVFWNEPPADEERKTPINKSKGTVLDFHPYEDEEWSETYITEGVKLEISNFLTATIQRSITDTVELFDTNPETQCISAAIQYGSPLTGESLINGMKRRGHDYPDGLRRAVIRANVNFGSRWSNREALLYRKDLLMLHRVMADAETKIMSILFALNRQYIVHPGFKWQRNSLEGMAIKPENIEGRMESVFLGNPQDAIKILEEIIREVFILIGKEIPDMDLSEAIIQTGRVRPRNDSR
ncbi:DUF4037 domain-containing protein [Planomicrobium sp. Y74]|uniref:DUF4037 domain-containing protein n=1 Tax=Planomicrobium sp. Y74 TaxID=2478977 RepID=UPI000EF43C56|nr:DUF4037 domain-containing protein [Planomicrobium sp. Y74]RLQ91490.1 DUF4037 domain-containing protein [Planomicrobium sp. Y74]